MNHRLIASLVLSAATFATLSGCQTNPATGKSQFQSLSRAEEVQMGVQAAPELTKEFGGKSRNPDLAAYVSEVGNRLAAGTEGDNPSLPWEFTLLDSDVINAFALPGGKVFLSRGLAQRMSNEAQLAGVLGHEIGHVTARHINDKITRETGTNLGIGVAGILLGGSQVGTAATNIGKQIAPIALLSYDRGQESEADHLGMRYMSRAMYNPLAQRQVMEILVEASKGGKPPEILSTHPDPANRIKSIDRWLASEFKDTQNNPRYVLKEQEFRARFLSRIHASGPHPAGAPHAALMAADPEGRAFALGAPSSWCAVCAANAR